MCLAIWYDKMSNQRVCLKSYVKKGIKCNELFKTVKKTFCDNISSQLRVYKSCKRFHERRGDVEDDARLGRPNTPNTDDEHEKKIDCT